MEARTGVQVRLSVTVNVLRSKKMSVYFLLLFFVTNNISLLTEASAPVPRRDIKRAVIFIAQGLERTTYTSSDLKTFKLIPGAETFEKKTIHNASLTSSQLSTGCDVVDPMHISMDHAGRELETTLDSFAEDGRSVGIVTTKCATDIATAPLWTHALNGYDVNELTGMLMQRARDTQMVIFGGTSRSDDPLLEDERICASDSWLDFKNSSCEGKKSVYGRFGAPSSVFAARCAYLPYEARRNIRTDPSLTDLVIAALNKLATNPNGYILFVVNDNVERASVRRKKIGISDNVHEREMRATRVAFGSAVMRMKNVSSSIAMLVSSPSGGTDTGFLAITGTSSVVSSLRPNSELTIPSAGAILRAPGQQCQTVKHIFTSRKHTSVSNVDFTVWVTVGALGVFVLTLIATKLCKISRLPVPETVYRYTKLPPRRGKGQLYL